MCRHLKSYQNLVLLKSLYMYKSLGFSFMDPIGINTLSSSATLPSDLEQLNLQISQCHLCNLSKSRQRALSGFGNKNAKIMFIDAYPSMIEDETAQSFSGRSGTSLKKMIENVLKLNVNEVYLTHMLKCRPSNNHQISDSEISSCKPYLFKQIELINPSVIVPLGDIVYTMLINDGSKFETVRGEKIEFGKRVVVPIYHPAYLLRNPSLKKSTMTDLYTIKGIL